LYAYVSNNPIVNYDKTGNGKFLNNLFSAIVNLFSKSTKKKVKEQAKKKNKKRKTFFKIYSNSKAITLYINNKAIKTIHSNQNKQKGIFIFKGIKLLKGQNLVCAVAESKGSLYFDTAVFHR